MKGEGGIEVDGYITVQQVHSLFPFHKRQEI